MTNPPRHTSGPWAVEPWQWNQGASLAIVAPANGYIVGIVPFDEDIQTVDQPDCDTVKRHPDEIPNAVLMAAAPALLEAGEKVVARREHCKNSALRDRLFHRLQTFRSRVKEEMHMGINEAGQESNVTQVNDPRVARMLDS